ncbi:MAG: hypothetical protein K6U12_13610 [Armatimonadetes bacterium]|nr:hypothetical protein [Armatimonadota bacterium]
MQVRDYNTPCVGRDERVQSRASWEAFANRLRRHVRFACGLLPDLPRAPLRVLRVPAYRGEGFRIERWALETLPGYYLTGSLFIPETPAGRRAPAMLQPHGHFEHGRLNPPDILRAIALAQAGAWVLMYDMVGYNDHFQLAHKPNETEAWHRWGFSVAGLQTWNSLCAFEWLARQPEVDAKRIGCSGISGGGTQTFLLAAVEPRLACAAPVKMVSTTMQGGCLCENPPLLRLFACNPEIAALCAPRPMLLISDSGDWTADNPEKVAPFLRRVYELYGVPERFQHAHMQEGHEFGQESRAVYYRWCAQTLGLRQVPRDPTIEPESLLPALRVWGEDLPRPKEAPEGEAVFEQYRTQVEAALPRWLRNRAAKQEMRQALLSMLGLENLPRMPKPRLRATACIIVAQETNVPRIAERLPALDMLKVAPPRRLSPHGSPFAYFATYNLKPLAQQARVLLEEVQKLLTEGLRVRLFADPSGAPIVAIVAALTGVPCQFEPPESPVDLPGWERIGGMEALRRVFRIG